MKRSELFFRAIFVPIDYLALVLAAFSAYNIRYLKFITDIRPVVFDLPEKEFAALVFVFAIIWVAIFALAGLYRLRASSGWEEFGRIFLSCSAGIALVMAGMFFSRLLFDSRFIILVSWVLSITFVTFERVIIHETKRQLYKKGIGVQRVALVGDGASANELVKEFEGNKRLGFRLVGNFSDFTQATKAQLKTLFEQDACDEVILTNPNFSRETMLELVELVNEYHRDFKFVADLLGTKISNYEVMTLSDIPIIEVKRTPLDGWGKILKRLFDIVFALILIIIFSPIMVIVAVAIKLDSRGPILFRYQRVGEKGKTIGFIKFRTMIDKAHELRYDEKFLEKNRNLRAGSPMIKFENDPRITRVGKFLRRFSIDEVPQFFLVLIGRMSLVGPRPHEIEEVAKYDTMQKRVLTVKPGITGLAQVSGRSDLSFDEEVRLDTFYIENWSLGFDLRIVFQTPGAVLKHRKAL